jgi:hypothetical protein
LYGGKMTQAAERRAVAWAQAIGEHVAPEMVAGVMKGFLDSFDAKKGEKKFLQETGISLRRRAEQAYAAGKDPLEDKFDVIEEGLDVEQRKHPGIPRSQLLNRLVASPEDRRAIEDALKARRAIRAAGKRTTAQEVAGFEDAAANIEAGHKAGLRDIEGAKDKAMEGGGGSLWSAWDYVTKPETRPTWGQLFVRHCAANPRRGRLQANFRKHERLGIPAAYP